MVGELEEVESGGASIHANSGKDCRSFKLNDGVNSKSVILFHSKLHILVRKIQHEGPLIFLPLLVQIAWRKELVFLLYLCPVLYLSLPLQQSSWGSSSKVCYNLIWKTILIKCCAFVSAA